MKNGKSEFIKLKKEFEKIEENIKSEIIKLKILKEISGNCKTGTEWINLAGDYYECKRLIKVLSNLTEKDVWWEWNFSNFKCVLKSIKDEYKW